MILRDWLALDRTVLANKRTFLAYSRTAIAMAVLGIAFIKLIGHPFFEISGFLLVLSGIVVFYVGAREYSSNTKRFKNWSKRNVPWRHICTKWRPWKRKRTAALEQRPIGHRLRQVPRNRKAGKGDAGAPFLIATYLIETCSEFPAPSLFTVPASP
ncbi:MAG: DUF202 domain-containing protein [Thiobacillus sp.]|uniref:DUF202 domain-containing protein n=1 Tax=Thiobacillus sp. TaxID=924 RepID=UPI00168CA137|nr:DUF202 domain-containing protein [Thiobacillus sp.]QLQ03397.1 MAG: DUF202 domain-containing protein [Thiobacillus sp.]